ncbi:MAG: putative Ig domain-containing protein [Firmicutes bacterium]|nr:putative Ig domain-containing protein [Bacillota bacterium]
MERGTWVLSAMMTGLFVTGGLLASPPTVDAATLEPPTVHGITYVANSAELEYLDQSLASASSPYAGATIDLTDNINMEGYAWQPWANFHGTLNGNGYAIMNVDVSTTTQHWDPTGIIDVFSGGIIENLGITNPSASQYANGSSIILGTLVGEMTGGIIEDVYVQGGEVTEAPNSIGFKGGIGGIVGEMSGGTLENSYATIYVNSPTPDIYYGGIAGTSFSSATVINDLWGTTSADSSIPAIGSGTAGTSVVTTTVAAMEAAGATSPNTLLGSSATWDFAVGTLPVLIPTAVPVPTVTVTASPGTDAGTTALSMTALVTGDTFAVQVGTSSPTIIEGETLPSSASSYVIGSNLTVSPDAVVTVYEVTPSGVVDAASTVIISGTEMNPEPLVISTTSLPTANAGSPYAMTLTLGGGNGQDTWSISSGTLPTGLTLSSSGVLSGIPTVTGTTTFTVEVTDTANQTDAATYTFTVDPAPLAIATTALPAATVGSAYDETLGVTGGNGQDSWSVTSGTLPAGLSLSSAGTITGTPTTAGTATVTLEVQDTAGQSASATLQLTVNPAALTVTTTALPPVIVNQPYDETLGAAGGNGGDTWTITGGALPSGLTLSSSGVLSGTVTATGTTTVTVTVTDAAGKTASTALTLAAILGISPPPNVIIQPISLPGLHGDIITNLGYNPLQAIQFGTAIGYIEERAALQFGVSLTGEGANSSYLTNLLGGNGVGIGSPVSPTQQAQFAALYQKLGIIPTWTNNTVTLPQALAALKQAQASSLAIENYLVQLWGYAWPIAQQMIPPTTL